MFVHSRPDHRRGMNRFTSDTLQVVGFTLHEDRIVKKGTTAKEGQYYQYVTSQYDDENLRRREQFRTAVRNVVIHRLNHQFELHELHLGGGLIHPDKPSIAHMRILMKKHTHLRRDVIVVVGEASQDLGIWSWKMTTSEPGIVNGTALGLAGMVQAWGQSQRCDMEEDMIGMDPRGQSGPEHRFKEKTRDATMGLIILNPGQLLWSSNLNTCMTHTSWQSQPKRWANDAPLIHPVYNRIPGHTTPEEHVRTFFEAIYPRLVDENARLYIVGVADGADYVLDYLNRLSPSSPLVNKVQVLGLIEPKFDPRNIRSDDLSRVLSTHCARAWVKSDLPLGTQISPPPKYPSLENIDTPTQASFNASQIAGADYDYGMEPKLCATYSGGEASYTEDIWPKAMGDVVTFFNNHQLSFNKKEDDAAAEAANAAWKKQKEQEVKEQLESDAARRRSQHRRTDSTGSSN